MTETIFDKLTRELDNAGSAVSQWFHPHNDATGAEITKGITSVSVLTDIHDTVASGLANIKGWATDLEQKLPDLAQRATRFENSPVVQELEKLGDLILPPEIEQSIVGLIQMGAKIAASAASDVSSEPPSAAAQQPVPVPASA